MASNRPHFQKKKKEKKSRLFLFQFQAQVSVRQSSLSAVTYRPPASPSLLSPSAASINLHHRPPFFIFKLKLLEFSTSIFVS
jgi:hypothetical protein